MIREYLRDCDDTPCLGFELIGRGHMHCALCDDEPVRVQHVHCPRCNSAPIDHDVLNFDRLWREIDVICRVCQTLVRSSETG